MAQTRWVCPRPGRQRIFYTRATHLVTYTGSHATCTPLCWQWVLKVCTPQWKYVTGFLKPDVVDQMQSVWIWEVLDGTNYRKSAQRILINQDRSLVAAPAMGVSGYQGTLGHSPP